MALSLRQMSCNSESSVAPAPRFLKNISKALTPQYCRNPPMELIFSFRFKVNVTQSNPVHTDQHVLSKSFEALLEDSMTHNLPTTLGGVAPDALPLAPDCNLNPSQLIPFLF